MKFHPLEYRALKETTMNQHSPIEGFLAREPSATTRRDRPSSLWLLLLALAIVAFVFLTDPSFVPVEQQGIIP
jgi:hypothetical protein